MKNYDTFYIGIHFLWKVMNWSFSRIKKLIEIIIFYRKTNFCNYLIR